MQKSIARLVCAGAAVVTLALGATEVFAVPAKAPEVRGCSVQQCNALCYPFKGECRGQCLCAG